jgi:hypothetical protein
MDGQTLGILIAAFGALLTGLGAFLWKLWQSQMEAHKTARSEDREDRKELVSAVKESGEKTASGIHELNLTMTEGFATLNAKVDSLQGEPFSRTRTDEDLPPLHMKRADTNR